MIIEIFGPPCVGKTTLAQALASHLQKHGLQVELALSYRPTELSADQAAEGSLVGQVGIVVRRVTRPMLEMLGTARELYGRSWEAGTATALLQAIPPGSLAWSIRLRQYIWRRAHLWRSSLHVPFVLIFDQAFVQVVYSLALAGAPVDKECLARAIDIVPLPDVLIRLDAPRATVEERLVDRRRRQGAIERLLEVDLRTHLESLGLIDTLHELLRRRGQAVIHVRSDDRESLQGVVEGLGREIMARFPAAAPAALAEPLLS
jgi:thymidylate kinase